MLSRLWYLLLAGVAFAVVVDAGWLEIPRDRLGGIAVLAFAVVLLILAVRPRRRA